jgi:hypothetical protein
MDRPDLRFELFGCVFEIRNFSPAVWRAVQDRLPPVGVADLTAPALRRYSAESDGAGFVVERARRRPAAAGTVSAAADLIVDDVERALSRAIDGRILVHAGAVRWRGRAILVPGRSGSGKSELVAALVRAGAGYLSDEFAVLDREGRVHPYGRPVALRRPSGVSRIAIEESAASPARRPVPVGRVVFVRYRAHARWMPRTLSPGAALLGLLRNTLSCRARLDDARSILRRIVAAVPATIGERPDADEIAPLLLAGNY